MPLRLRRNSMQRVEFWKNAYVPDLTFESGGEDEEKNGRWDRDRFSVGRMSDFHADESARGA